MFYSHLMFSLYLAASAFIKYLRLKPPVKVSPVISVVKVMIKSLPRMTSSSHQQCDELWCFNSHREIEQYCQITTKQSTALKYYSKELNMGTGLLLIWQGFGSPKEIHKAVRVIGWFVGRLFISLNYNKRIGLCFIMSPTVQINLYAGLQHVCFYFSLHAKHGSPTLNAAATDALWNNLLLHHFHRCCCCLLFVISSCR